MKTNYLKTAWRNLVHNKTFSLLNIAGLAIGIACAGLIFLWVEYNLTFNSSIPDLKNIYTVENNQFYGKDQYTFNATPFRLKDALLDGFSGVENVSRFVNTGATIVLQDKVIAQSGGYADSGFLKMFGLPLIEGNANDALNDMSQIVISDKISKSYFGNENPIGKLLQVNNQPYKVSAVFKDIPQNMQFYGIDFLLPFQVYYNQNKDGDEWGNNYDQTWVQLNPNANVTAINKQVGKIIQQHNPKITNQSLFLYPMERMALHGQFTNGKEDSSKGMIQYVRMFSIIALIILIIACINFMNLSTAQSEKRSKEIGMRKVLGSGKFDLITRLLSESLLMAFLSVFLAVAIVALALPAFGNLIGIQLRMNIFQPSHILFLIAIGIVCGLVAGSYPAIYLSSFNPIQALKKQATKSAGSVGLVRKGLVVLQFAVSVIIIIAVIVVYRQIQFTKNRDLGFSKDNVLYVNSSPELLKNYSSLKQSVLNVNGVSSVSLGSNSPMAMYSNGGGIMWEGKNPNEDVLVTYASSDNDYLKTFDIPLKDGRNFSPDPKSDSTNVIINETFAKLMGKAGHVGSQLWWDNNREHAVTIKGITKDFIYNDVNSSKPAPLLLTNKPENANLIFIKLNPSINLQGDISNLRKIFTTADASQPFDYHFLDKDFENKFRAEQFIGTLATIFGCLAIFISCLGLFGLSAFMAEQRTKEIGIRKVLGASVSGITGLLSKDFLKLVVIGCLIAFPFSWWIMHNWLQDYEYRIGISWWIFILAGLTAVLIAIITISFQSIKAALANPVKSLRTE